MTRLQPFLAVTLVVFGCASPTARQPVVPAGRPAVAPSRPVATIPTLDIATETQGRGVCFVVTDGSGASSFRSGDEPCSRRYRPYSTFKIPHSLIGLETGVIADASTVIPWDRFKYPKQDWWPAAWTEQEHDLRSAIRVSFVPYYRALATRIGAPRMAEHVRRFRYGNQSIEGNLDSFWLDGDIAISPDEQVAFLRDFYGERLGVSSRATNIVKDILVRERHKSYVLSAKTGTGDGPGGATLAWLVGYVEDGAKVHFFAFDALDDNGDELAPAWRFRVVTEMLARLGVIQASAD